MIGTSYEGTLPLAAATTGVKGLEVVVPVSPNTSYYHYYRSNGLVRSPGGYLGEDVDVLYDFIASGDSTGRANCERIWKNGIFAGPTGQDRASGDYNDFWSKRDLLPYVKNIKAAVLLAHGFNDYNVVPEHSVRIYDEMKSAWSAGLDLSPSGRTRRQSARRHVESLVQPLPLRRRQRRREGSAGVDRSGRLRAGAAGGCAPPPLLLPPRRKLVGLRSRQRRLHGDGRARGAGRGRGVVTPPTPFASFPVPGSVPVVFHPTPAAPALAKLSFAAAKSGTDKLVDDVAMSGSADASAEQSPNRLLYATPAFIGHGAHLRNAEGHAARRVERAGREPERVARHAAIRFCPRRIAEPCRSHHPRVGRHPELQISHDEAGTTNRSAPARSSRRARSTISPSICSRTTSSCRPASGWRS